MDNLTEGYHEEERWKAKFPPADSGKKETVFCKYNPILVIITNLPLFFL